MKKELSILWNYLCLNTKPKKSECIIGLGSILTLVPEKCAELYKQGLGKYIETAVLEEDTTKHKPDSEPILECLKRLNIKNEDAIYIGDNYSDYQTCKNAHVDFGLAKWGCTKEFETDSSCLIFNQPLDLLKLLDD